MTQTLQQLRQQIDSVDQQLLGLLNQRASLANEVGEIKRHEGSPVFRPEREAQVIHGLQTASPGPLKGDSIAHIWREVMSACRALEAPQRVAYLGPAGTFSEQAAVQFFGSSIEHVPCASFDEVFRAATAGTAQFGVVPVENNTEGVVTRTLDLFLNSPVHVIGETSLLVRHNLLRQSASLEGIEVVLAHAQALAQCQGWLNTHLPHAERRAVSSNAEGARIAAGNPAWAAIASERAGAEFGLHVSAHAIQHAFCGDLPAPGAGRARGFRHRLHQSDRVRAQQAGRRARHPGAPENPWRVDDPFRIPPGPLGPVGIFLLH
jgi:chorismate mutase/prephenate dehydratase